MSTRYDKLLSSLRLGRRTAHNRLVFATHQTNFATHNRFEQRHAAYYEARAAGGTGVIVLEGSVVHESDRPYEYAIFGSHERVVDGYRMVADAVHRHGALALAHLTHSGMQGSSHFSQLPLWAPSPVPEVNSREVPKEMEADDIAAVIAGFARVAGYAIAGGLDGVEINAGQDSLVRQFLSPLTNMRGDQYGGSLDNRLRFARAVIAAVRNTIGRDPIVGLRLSGDEYAPWAGLKPEDTAEIARLLAEDGQLDFISVTSGSIYSSHLTRAGLFMPPGYAAHLAAGIKQVVQVPVFAQGSIADVGMAEGLLVEEQADAIEMTRALMADPDIIHKLREGRPQDIRPCILSNQDNIITMIQNPRLSCVNNPAAGYESDPEFAFLPPAPIPGHIMVIGGGAAGLEAARIAALRGHRVTLTEREERLGGTLRLAAAAPGRERLALAVDWLEAQVRELGVTINLGSEATLESVQAAAPDAVIVTVGGLPSPWQEVEGAAASWQTKADTWHTTLPATTSAKKASAPPVVNPRQVLSGAVPEQPGKAVLLDQIGDQVGMGVAEWLADHGWEVVVVTSDMFVGQRLTATMELTPWNQRACAKGITFQPQVNVVRFEGQTLIGSDIFDRTPVHIEAITLIVNVTHEVPNEALYFALKEAGYRVYRAGDCVAPRYMSHAILEGYRAGREV